MSPALAKFLAKAENAIKGTPRVVNPGGGMAIGEYSVREGGLKDFLRRAKYEAMKNKGMAAGVGVAASPFAALALMPSGLNDEDRAMLRDEFGDLSDDELIEKAKRRMEKEGKNPYA